MSKAYKCDRCGTLYGCNDHACNSLYVGHRPYGGNLLDLCPMCQKELENWLALPDSTDYNYSQVCGKKSKEEEI